MKNLIILISVSIIFTSCGGADNDTVEIDGVLPSEHRVFITKNSSIKADFSSSGLSGLAGADRLCDTYAQAAGLTKDYKAILSDANIMAKDRLVLTGSIYTVSGSIKIKVAESSVELWNADTVDLLSKIDWDEDGKSVSSANVWTGSNADGTIDGDHCDSWTDTSAGKNGQLGDVDETGQLWISKQSLTCLSTVAHLYCISQ
jgi:hypothetical protein